MSKLPFFPFLMIPLTAAACSDDPASITISTMRAPEAIAFRDGLDGAWQVPTPTSTGEYEIVVNGPYMVSVVCSVRYVFPTTLQIARTPDDPRELDLECAEIPEDTADVTANVVQPGTIGLGDSYVFSDTPDWDLTMSSPAGTFDLIGVSEDRIMLRRDLAVTSGAVDLGTIDIDTEGVPLVPTALTVSNAATGEMIEAVVLVSTPRNASGYVHQGSPASAKIAPTSFLSADVRQTVKVVGWQDDGSRSVRRDFRAGDATAFTLPEPLGKTQCETTSGEFVATWSTLPEHDKLIVWVYGEQADGKTHDHELELSKSFMGAAGKTSATLDIGFPGYLPAWQIDFGREYLCQVQVVRERDGEQATSSSRLMRSEPPQQVQGRQPRSLPRTATGKLRLAR
jgi:hypothetical protein